MADGAGCCYESDLSGIADHPGYEIMKKQARGLCNVDISIEG